MTKTLVICSFTDMSLFWKKVRPTEEMKYPTMMTATAPAARRHSADLIRRLSRRRDSPKSGSEATPFSLLAASEKAIVSTMRVPFYWQFSPPPYPIIISSYLDSLT